VETRLQTFRNAAEAGLLLGTCLEPVGTEHTIGELVQKTIITGRRTRCIAERHDAFPCPARQ